MSIFGVGFVWCVCFFCFCLLFFFALLIFLAFFFIGRDRGVCL